MTSTTPSQPVLEGFVEYRWNLAPVDANANSNNKKPRGSRRETNAADKDDDEASRQPQQPDSEAGFYLVTANKSSNKSCLYLLSVPQHLLKTVCDAARFHLSVRVSRYNVAPLTSACGSSNSNNIDQDKQPTKKRRLDETSTSTSSSQQLALVEILENGLELLTLASLPSDHEKPDSNEFLSLQQVYCQEEEINDSNNPAVNGGEVRSKKRSKNRRFNLQGMVDSISPIICMDHTTNEPFALMELYDNPDDESGNDNNNINIPWSCVVVFVGVASLTCHEGIVPGDRIMLKQVKRQKWRKQNEIWRKTATTSRFRDRVPSHVFVVQDAQSVLWTRQPQTTISLPSTPVPLVSLRGKVVSIAWARRGGGRKGIHSVEIDIATSPHQTQSATHDTTVRHVLFLLYYPMAPSLTLSLRPGAVIQAVNIHRIGVFDGFHSSKNSNSERELASPPFLGQTIYYGACLRSTVSVLAMPPPSNNNQLQVPTRPYAFSSIQRMYLEYACQDELRSWYNDKNNLPKTKLESSSASGSANILPSFEDIANTWEEQFWHERINVARDPYMEFFDHACDDDADEGDRMRQSNGFAEFDDESDEEEVIEVQSHASKMLYDEGCYCSRQQEPKKLWPCWVALHDVRNEGFRVMKNILETTIRQSRTAQATSTTDRRFKPQIGWTGSTHFTPSELLQSFASNRRVDGNLSDLDSVALYTGGRVSNYTTVTASSPVKESLGSASLANDHCVLPATTIQELLPQEKPGSYTFAVGKLHGIVMSCFCVGVEASPLSDTKSTAVPNNAPTGKQEQKSTGATQADSGMGKNVSRIILLPHHGDDGAQNDKGSKDDSTPRGRFGACSLFHTDGFLFLLSIQLVFTMLVPVVSTSRRDLTMENGDSKGMTKPSHVSFQSTEVDVRLNHGTIRQCLDPDELSKVVDFKHNTTVLGMQVRQRFRLSKITDNRYRGCVLTLSHIPLLFNHLPATVNFGPKDVSTLQTIEVKATVHFKTAANKRSYLWREITRLLQSTTLFAMDDATALALAFWNIADTADICALTAGGWDDALNQPSTKGGNSQASNMFNVVVQLPGKVVQGPDARGYERFACPVSQIRARFLQFEYDGLGGQKNDKVISRVPETLSAIGGMKFLPGMLDRRPVRCPSARGNIRRISDESPRSLVGKGPLVGFPPAPMSGVPECRIVNLLRAICLDLQAQQNRPASAHQTRTGIRYMAPSLVRRVTGARFLGASFCQAQAICGKCFQALSQPKQTSRKKDGHENRKQSARNKKQGWDSQKQTTFWHCPLPISATEKDKVSASQVAEESVPETLSKSQVSEASKSSTLLRCPNGCSVPTYAEIKWECSGTLDDGTGQAKLYAERDAATTLLGLGQDVIDMIEDGVWKSRNGKITFSKTVPPPSHLAKAVEAANFVVTAREKERKKHPKRRGISAPATNNDIADEDEALQLMEPADRALYLMIQECRELHLQTSHRMDFMVRCKPLSDAAVHLNHTEIDVMAPGKHEGSCSSHPTATYSMLPLKLNLVDLAFACRENIVEETWDILRALSGGIQ